MDNFELKPEPKVKKRNSLVWNILTVIVLLATCSLAYFFLIIFNNPNSPINPFKPAPIATRYQTGTPTNIIIPLPPTWTPTPTHPPYPSRTRAPTWTLLPETATSTMTEAPAVTLTEGTPSRTEVPSWTPLPATATSSITASPTNTLTDNTPTITITPTPMPATAEFTYQASTTMHADSACSWMGVGGKVLDTDGEPLQFQTVQLGGSLNNKLVNSMMRSGDVPAYGTSGFEFLLGNDPLASTQELWIQLFDNTGKPLTEKIFFDTYDDCNKNLVMVVFTKTR